MRIKGDDRISRLVTCPGAAVDFDLTEAEAVNLIEGQIAAMPRERRRICDEARLFQTEAELLAGRDPRFVDGLAAADAEWIDRFDEAHGRVSACGGVAIWFGVSPPPWRYRDFAPSAASADRREATCGSSCAGRAGKDDRVIAGCGGDVFAQLAPQAER
jgi:hypothetical protein